MKNSPSLKEYQLLSAYLDGRCSSREKAHVESLLAANAEYKQTLAEFSRYKKMIAAVPNVRAPRNFTLSPKLAPHKPQRFFAVPVLNYASLTATVLCVLLFAGSRILPIGRMQTTGERAVPMMALAAEDTSAEATPIPMINWGIGGAEGKGGGGGGSEGATAYGLGGGPGGETVPQATESPEVTGTILQATEAPMLTTESDSSTASNATSPILGVPSEDTRGKILTSDSTLPEHQPFAVSLSWVTVSEIALAAAAVVCAIIALILRKRR